MPGTVSRHRPRNRQERLQAELVLALEGAQPFSAPERIALSDVDVIEVGRGEARKIGRSGARKLGIELADSWLSTRHARFVGAGGGWFVEDLDSKNGTLVGGVEQRRIALGDGDVIELGRTFFVYREVPATEAGVSTHAALATMSRSLGRDFAQLERIARTEVPVLVRGQTGTGKELVARAVHELSARKGRFVAVNCGALVESLAQSELFGYRRGAFSGALEDRAGLVRAAEAGTLFLDEIGDMPLPTQAVLLRVLQEREVKPLGATESTAVDVRVVSATHQDLEGMMERGSFRADLFARLSGFDLTLPPLAARREDIGLLVARMLERNGIADITIDAEAARALFLYAWPLNVREIEKAVARAVALRDGDRLGLEHLPPAVQRVGTEKPASEPAALDDEDLEWRDRVIEALARHGGNVSAVARDLEKDRKQIHRWIQRFGIDLANFRES
ncbi:MAG TPA: sigma 54-interacting transcriptional regulator [Polyangiaceae bacterium]|nr:sigma 54-interacting transcriptional regulator [Polyangiaceae bacterium]